MPQAVQTSPLSSPRIVITPKGNLILIKQSLLIPHFPSPGETTNLFFSFFGFAYTEYVSWLESYSMWAFLSGTVTFKMEQLTTVCPHSSRFPALLVEGLGVPLGADILSRP